ncbi:MAG: hypothetical protein H7145_13085 [Akkermansiaceae bacterium]|nr:hypothetical protein [Armatimonadota bacterium]
MNRKLPTFLGKLAAIFFFAWFTMAGWFLFCGDDSPVMRLAFAVCGCLWLFADSHGGLSQRLRQQISSVHEWSCRKRLYGWAVGVILVSFPVCYGVEFLNGVRDFYREGHVRYEIVREGEAILNYTVEHGGILPSNLHGAADDRDFLRKETRKEPPTKPPGMPFIRQGELSGLSITDIREPGKVIVMYSRETPGQDGRVAFFLDGNAKIIRDRVRFSILLREQGSHLAHAVNAKVMRLAKGKR